MFVILASLVGVISCIFGYISLNSPGSEWADYTAGPSANWRELIDNGNKATQQDFMNFRTPNWCLVPKITFSFGFQLYLLQTISTLKDEEKDL